MSAWVTTHSHCTALAKFAVDHGLSKRTVAELAELLYEENCRSVDYRYDEHNERDFKVCKWALKQTFSYTEIYKSANCLVYQSCEHPGWEDSEARNVCELIELHLESLLDISDAAICATPEYNTAPWGIEKEQRKKSA